MGRGKAILKNTFIYAAGNFSSKFLNLLLLPFYTHYLTRDEFGYYDVIFATIQIAIPFLSFQISDGMYRFLLDESEENAKSTIIKTTLLATFASLLFYVIACLATFRFVHVRYAHLILVQAVLFVLATSWQIIARGEMNVKVYSISGVINTFVTVILNVLLICCLDMRVNALILSNIAASLFTILYIEMNLNSLKRAMGGVFSFDLLKRLLKYSLPLMPNALSWWMVNYSSRYLIVMYMSNDANGIFAVASKFPMFLVFINQIYYLAWQESAILEAKSKDRDVFYSKMFKLYMRLQMSIILLILPATKLFLFHLVDVKFMESWFYIPLLYLGTVVMSFATFFGTMYLTSKNTIGVFYTTMLGAGINIVVSLILLPKIGLFGAAIANLLASLAVWMARLYETRRDFRISVDYRGFIQLLIAILVYMSLYYVDSRLLQGLLMVGSMGFIYYYNKELLVHLLGKREWAFWGKNRSVSV